MTKRLLIIVVITVAAVLGFSKLANTPAEAHAHEEEEQVDVDNIGVTLQQMKVADIRLGQVTRQPMNTSIPVNGQLTLRPQALGEVTSLMGGVVKRILVTDGQAVRKGQVVALIENTDIVAMQREYYSASRQSQFAQLEMERQQKLRKTGAGVERNLQQAEKDLRVAQANLAGLGRQLQQVGVSPSLVAKGRFVTTFPVHAPISGTVSSIGATLGSYVDMQTPLMQVRDNSALECDVNVFEKDLDKVKVGQSVQLSVTNQRGKRIAGTVYGINGYFNKGAKTVAVHVRLHDTARRGLVDGMYVDGVIVVGSREAETLPSTAIVRADGKSYIFALNGKRTGGYSFSRHEVTTGSSMNGNTQVELCEHIRKGQEIVTDNAYYLASMTGEHGEH